MAAGRLAMDAGARWRPLRWEGAKPRTGLPAAARAARHALLAEATREAGAVALLLGHTADDTAESELIRRETPTHGRLRAWSPSPAWPQGRGVFLLRPLLALRRSELRAWLMGQGVGWLDDPANADPRFARTHARWALAADGTCRWTSSAAPEAVMPLVEVTEAWGGLEMDRAALLAATSPVLILGRALLCAGGGQRPAGRAAVARMLEALAGKAPTRAVVGGARLAASGEQVRLSRELGRSSPATINLAADVSEVFDGRFELEGHAPGWTVRPLAGSLARLPRREHEGLRALAPDVRASLPLLCGPQGELGLPAPLGRGPARMRSLVGPRLEAALGRVQDEATAVRAAQADEAHGDRREAVLSCPAETKVLRQAAAARRMATCPTP